MSTKEIEVELTILGITRKGSIKAATAEDPLDWFWLPNAHIVWVGEPEVGKWITAYIPFWLARTRHQLVSKKDYKPTAYKPRPMQADRPDPKDVRAMLRARYKEMQKRFEARRRYG